MVAPDGWILVKKEAWELAICALMFYDDPDTWFATALFPDPPAGEINSDYRETDDLGWKPGKTAQDALDWIGMLMEEKP